ncbi:M20/M25/M40 family metallo-hydrolase [Nocardia violaceofusca]|uniref:M20/M25/M40 family metallo-hydrolase n=1 Tax=Nocardia violaceofusca TaxID=941182 RepID=UPI0009FF9339|nr:M20/M25/M40 family metallo-hydrolase [Nocardia violaceofusca]
MGRRVSGVLAFAVLVLIAIATAWEQQPHGYRDVATPAGEFSAERALATIREIASRPHPVGTAEHDRVRDHLVGKLRELGLDTDVRYGVGRYPVDPHRAVAVLGQTGNIVARWPGSGATGTIYLVAHYDSVPPGPGANDDGAGVATVLETVRALRASGLRPRNDLVVLFTDAEEVGLLGAEAFASSGAADPRGGVVINHEARGAGGPPMLWRLSHPDAGLISVVTGVPHPNTDSLSTTLAGDQTGSTTDFAALDPHGFRVLDWAFAGRNAYYHNPFDDPDHVDLATVQQFGDNTTAAAREFAARDLRAAADQPDRAYFPLPFGALVVLPLWVVVVAAVASVLLVAWVVWRIRRTGEATIGRTLAAAATALVAVPIGMGVVYGLWTAITAIRPEYRALFVDPYRPQCYGAAVVMACVAVLAAWYALSRRLFGPSATAVGVLCAVTAIGAVVTALSPAAGVMVVIPALAAVAGVVLTFTVPDRLRLPVLTLFLVPAAVFAGGTAYAALQTGIAAAACLTAPVVLVLGGLLTLTLTHAWPSRRGVLVPVAAVVVTVALAAAGTMVDRFDARHPLMSQLSYALDANSREAQWISTAAPDRWTREFVETGSPHGAFAQLWTDAAAVGAAPAHDLPGPAADILSDRTEADLRTVRLRLRSTRGATSVALRYSGQVRSLTVAGRDITPVPAAGVRFYAPPAAGVEVELTAPPGPLTLRAVDYSWLPDAHLADAPADIYYRQDSAVAVFTTIRL